MLYGYGAYGIPSDPDFDPQRLSLLRRGVAYVIAHVRGGGDLGGAWHDAGRGQHRDSPAIGAIHYLNKSVPADHLKSVMQGAGGDHSERALIYTFSFITARLKHHAAVSHSSAKIVRKPHSTA